MTGILLIFVVGMWFFIVKAIYKANFRDRESNRKTKIKAALFWLIVFPLPVADEVIGGIQFRVLCAMNTGLKIDAEAIKGKTVKIVVDPSNETVRFSPLKIWHSQFSFRDITTNEEYAHYGHYSVDGGLFIRALGISNSNSPLTIPTPYCRGSVGGKALARLYDFKYKE